MLKYNLDVRLVLRIDKMTEKESGDREIIQKSQYLLLLCGYCGHSSDKFLFVL